jgi:hypothetical protein
MTMAYHKWNIKVSYVNLSKILKKPYSICMFCFFALVILSFPSILALENTPPTLEPIENKFIAEGSKLTFILNATDPDGDSLNFSAINLPEGATLDAINGNFTWIPNYDQAGNYSIQFIVVDINGAMDSKNVSIQVLDFNRPPKLDPIGDKKVMEGEELVFTIFASDPDGDSLTFFTLGLPKGANFNSSTRTFQWIPAFGDAGNYSITFTASDSKGGEDSETITISVITKKQKLKSSIDELIQKVQDYYEADHNIDNKSIKNSLISKLNIAKKKLLEGRYELTKNVIKAFINQIKAQSGKHISHNVALNLIEMAQRILDILKN